MRSITTRTRRVIAWCKDNERELALAICGFVAGMHVGRVAGRHER